MLDEKDATLIETANHTDPLLAGQQLDGFSEGLWSPRQ
jgi:hypothetical protein